MCQGLLEFAAGRGLCFLILVMWKDMGGGADGCEGEVSQGALCLVGGTMLIL